MSANYRRRCQTCGISVHRDETVLVEGAKRKWDCLTCVEERNTRAAELDIRLAKLKQETA